MEKDLKQRIVHEVDRKMVFNRYYSFQATDIQVLRGYHS